MPKYRVAIEGQSGGVISPFHGGEHEFAELPRWSDFISITSPDGSKRDWFKVVAVLHELKATPGGPLIIVQKAEGQAPMSWGMESI